MYVCMYVCIPYIYIHTFLVYTYACSKTCEHVSADSDSSIHIGGRPLGDGIFIIVYMSAHMLAVYENIHKHTHTHTCLHTDTVRLTMKYAVIG